MSPADDDLYPATPDPGGVSIKVLVPQAIERRWGALLNPNDRAVFLRIQDMTVQWGFDHIDTTIGEIVDGRTSGKGQWNTPPIGIGRTTVKACLAKLVDLGIVNQTLRYDQKTGCMIGLKLSVNVELVLAPWEITAVPPTIPTPKRLNAGVVATRPTLGQETTDPWSPRDRPLVATRPHNTDTYTSTFTDTSHHGAAAPVTAAAVPATLFDDGFSEDEFSEDERAGQIEMPFAESQLNKARAEKSDEPSVREIVEAHRAAAAKKVATRLQSAINRVNCAAPLPPGQKSSTIAGVIRGADLELVWGVAWADAFRDETRPPLWSKQERGQAMALFARWPKVNGAFCDFLTFAVTNWRPVTGKLSGLHTPPPTLPKIGFLGAFFEHFHNEFMTKARARALDDLSLSQVEELVAKGYSQDNAIQIVAEAKVRAAAEREAARLPKARVRTRPAPVAPAPLQPVATERGLPRGEEKPTSVARQLLARTGMSAADADRAFFGKATTNNGETNS